MSNNAIEIKENLEILKSFTSAFGTKIDAFIKKEIERWILVDGSITPPLTALSEFIKNGGKRLRPAFCFLGSSLMGSNEHSENLLNAACALEMLHNFALVHDDIMDRSDTRRGAPTVHKFLEEMYSEPQYRGDIEHFATSVAVLAGDFAFTYADTFARGLPKSCLDIYELLKVELFAGQQMDIDAGYRKVVSIEQITKIAQYKSGKYTIERPIHMGAIITNEKAPLELLSKFGSPLGEAFQLRDDVLGVIGDSKNTGKPVGDDIREGKFTLLMAYAIENANIADQKLLDRRGSDDITQVEIEKITSIIINGGALEAVESKIKKLYDEAIGSLDILNSNETAIKLAKSLAGYVCWREA